LSKFQVRCLKEYTNPQKLYAMTKIILIILLIIPTVVYTNGIQKNKSISLFRASGYYDKFCIKVDGRFNYFEKQQDKGNGAFGYLIGRYKTNNNVIKIDLKINDRDTSFTYNIEKYDSLMIGLNGSKNFFVFNEKEYVWAND